MQPRGHFPAAAGSRTHPDSADRQPASRADPVCGLSDTAVQRPEAMARLILRRVGIAPLLGLFALLAPILGPPPAQADATIAVTHRATARVIILRQSVRLHQGQISVENGQNPAFPTASFLLSPPHERACEASFIAATSHSITPPPTTASCRLITRDMP